jgi:hypothetical protein
MKVRYGFVSNSSSSSFTCLVCGKTESGRDVSPRDFGFVSCNNGHMICDGHLINAAEKTLEYKIQLIRNSGDKEYIEELEEDLEMKDEYEKMEAIDNIIGELDLDTVDPSECPICQFVSPLEYQLGHWLLKKLGWTQKDALQKAKDEYEGDIKKFAKDNN